MVQMREKNKQMIMMNEGMGIKNSGYFDECEQTKNVPPKKMDEIS